MSVAHVANLFRKVSDRRLLWPLAAAGFCGIAWVNLYATVASHRRHEALLTQTAASYAALGAFGADTSVLLGSKIVWPEQLRLIRPTQGVTKPYKVVVFIDANRCKLHDRVSTLLRELRTSGNVESAKVVMYSQDRWTVESYARVHRLTGGVWQDSDRSFAKSNGIRWEPMALVVDANDRIVAAATSEGKGKDLWPAYQASILRLVAAR